jgi:hypothetical protein
VESPLGRSVGDIVPSCDFESRANDIEMPPVEAMVLTDHVCKASKTVLYTKSTTGNWHAAKGGG